MSEETPTILSSQSDRTLEVIKEETNEDESEKKKKKRAKKTRMFNKRNPFTRDSSKTDSSEDMALSVASSENNSVSENSYNDTDELKYDSKEDLEKDAVDNYVLGVALGDANPKAIVYLHNALRAKVILVGEISYDVAEIHYRIGHICKANNYNTDAVRRFEYVLKIFRALENREKYKTPEEREHMLNLRKQATENLIEVETRSKMQPTTGAVTVYKSDTLFNAYTPKSLEPKEQIGVYREIERLGDYEGETGKLDKAVIYYKYAIKLLQTQMKPDSEHVLGAQVKLADTFMRNGEIMQAINLHTTISDFLETKRAKNIYFLKVMIYNSSGNVTNEQFAPIFKVEKMGDKFLATGKQRNDYDQAIIFYRNALTMLLKINGIKPGSKHILRLHIKIGTVTWMSDESGDMLGDMLKAYSQALSYFEGMGDKMIAARDYENSSHCYTQVLRFLLKILKPDHDIVRRIQIKLGDVCLKTGAGQAALELYERAMMQMNSDGDLSDMERKLLSNVANAHKSIGDDELSKNDGKSALRHYQKLQSMSQSKLDNKKKTASDWKEEANILDKIGEAYFMVENYKDAETSYLTSLKIRESNAIEDVPATAHTNHKLGSIYYFTYRYADAEQYFEKAIAQKEKIYATFDRRILVSKLALCFVYQKIGNKKKAYQKYIALLNEFERSEPDGHPMGTEHVVASHQLAKLYTEDGNWNEAFKIHERRLRKLQQWNNATPMLIFDTLRDMGEVLATEGKFKSAIEYYEMALKESENIPPEQLGALNEKFYVSVGYCYASIEEIDKALQYYARALSDDGTSIENQLIYNNIGTQLAKLGKYEEALKFFHSSLLHLQDGDNDDIVMMAYNNIGNVYYKTQDEEQALEYYTSALERSKSKGLDLPSFTFYNLGILYLNKGHTAKAKQYFQDFLHSVDKSVMNRENKAMKANGLNNIGKILYEEGQFEDAVERYEEALELKSDIFGDDSEEIFGTISNLASVCYQYGNYNDAHKYYTRALDLALKYYPQSGKAPTILNSLGGICMIQKSYNEALGFFRRAENELAIEDNQKELLHCQHRIGIVLAKLNRYDEAADLYRDVHERMKVILGETNNDTIKVLLSLASLRLDAKQLEEAKNLCVEALSTLNNGDYPSSHPLAKRARKILAKSVHKFLE